MKNVRKKRFRKTAPKKIIDDPEVEKEVRYQLFSPFFCFFIGIVFMLVCYNMLVYVVLCLYVSKFLVYIGIQ